MRYCILLSMAGWFVFAVAGIAQAQEARVGLLGDPSRLAVRGVKSVPPDQVSRALFDDIDVAYASFPDAPLEELKRLLVEKAVLGFKHSGFPAPHVTVADRLDHLELTVEEGPRWGAGEIRVNGAKAVDARKLVAGLLPDRAAPASAWTQSTSRWPVGQPALLDQPSRQALSKRVGKLLAQQGYINAKSSVQVVGDHDHRVGMLVVAIEQEGEPARVRDIELEGNIIHTREQILAWLRLPPDAVVSVELCEDIWRRLNASGRFTKCAFYPMREATKPRLWVKEFTYAPRLDQPLSREEEALLKLAAWVGAFDQQGDDLVVTKSDGCDRPEVVFSPRRAFVMPMNSLDSLRTPYILDLALVCSEDQISISSAKHGRKLAIDCGANAFFPRATFALVHHYDGDCAWNFWFVTRKPERNGQATIGPILTAASALSIVRKHRARCTWDGPILTAQWKKHRMRLDSRDGRLIELEDGEGQKLFFRAGDKYNWVTKPVAGQFAQESTKIAHASANFTNVANSRRFFSSATDFICQAVVDYKQASHSVKELATAVGHLSRQGAFRAIDDLFFALAHEEPHPFLIPQTLPPDNWDFRFDDRGFRYVMKRLAVRCLDELFARESRLWLTCREAAFIVNGKSEHMHERLARLFPEDHIGPVTALVLAEAMMLSGMKADAGDWARRGLEQVTLDAFRRDYADLLVPGSRIPDYVLTAAAAIRGLERDQVDTLMYYLVKWDWLSRSQMRQATFFANELRSDASRPMATAVGAALDGLWQSTLEKEVTERLEAIVAAAEPVKDQQQARRRGLFLR
jgi:hypothetical protein